MRYAIAVLLSFTAVAHSDEVAVPAFHSPPSEYRSQDGGSLLLGDRTDKDFKFWFNVQGPNGHQCYLAGIAVKEDKHSYAFIENECRLTIKVIADAVVLLDQCNKCRSGHCGARAYMDGETFFRTGDS